MSSLNITVEIKAPRLWLIKTQQNQSALLSKARPEPSRRARSVGLGRGACPVALAALHHVALLSPRLTIIIRENILRMTFL